MVDRNTIEYMAAQVMGVEPDASDEEVQKAFREMVSEVHPDTSDAPDATEAMSALNEARDILLGDFNFADAGSYSAADDLLRNVLDEDEIEDAQERSDTRGTYQSEAEKRTDPTGFDVEDFSGMGPQERSQMVKTVSLGVETMLAYQAVRNLFSAQYSRDEFFRDVNDYIEDNDLDKVSYEEFYWATEQNLRDDITREIFIESIQNFEEGLEEEYGQGTSLKEVARIIAYFIVQGGVDIGFGERFMQSGKFGRDTRFSRGPGPGFERSQKFSRGRGGEKFGRDERFER